MPRCLKITEEVSFNIASEGCYVYIWKVNQKCQKIAVKLHYQQVTGNRWKRLKFKCDFISNFQTLCHYTIRIKFLKFECR